MIITKRIYEPARRGDGYRVLVDRLWPRGVSKERAKLGTWMKDIGPSAELRTWFGHREERWREFRKRYRKELRSKQELLADLRNLERQRGVVTLLYGARDRDHNEAIVIAEALR
jgi:uncharacterized protein YeaO (DUF488 family)